MKEAIEYLSFLWNCKFCGYLNKIDLRKRMNGDFPEKKDYQNYQPYSCFHCGSHEHFELKESRLIERLHDR